MILSNFPFAGDVELVEHYLIISTKRWFPFLLDGVYEKRFLVSFAHDIKIRVFCPFVWMFVRDLLHGCSTDLDEIAHGDMKGPHYIISWAGESQCGNRIGSELVFRMTDCVNLGTHLVTSSLKPASFYSKTASYNKG